MRTVPIILGIYFFFAFKYIVMNNTSFSSQVRMPLFFHTHHRSYIYHTDDPAISYTDRIRCRRKVGYKKWSFYNEQHLRNKY